MDHRARTAGTLRLSINRLKLSYGCEPESRILPSTKVGVDVMPSLSAASASACAGVYATGSQLGDALAALAEGNVVLITIDIGSNDITQAFIDYVRPLVGTLPTVGTFQEL